MRRDELFNPLDPAFLEDPHSGYARLRETDPVHWHEGIQAWILSSHRDCARVLGDPPLFASDWRRVGVDVPPAILSIQALDPPEHTPVRHLLVEAFKAQRFDLIGQQIGDSVAARLDRLTEVGSFDFMSQFATPLALETIALLLGVQAPEVAWFAEVSQTIVNAMDAGLVPEAREPGLAARAELAALTDSWLLDPPDHGVIGFVARAAGRDETSRQTLANTMRVLLHAGYESFSRFLGNAVLALLQHPGGLKALHEVDLRVALDELLRYGAPVQGDSRVCVADTWIGGRRLRRGDIVTLLLAAANRDPVVFTDPDELLLDRRPNPHLAFGRGLHACLGARFAHLQARVILRTLAERHPSMQLAGAPVFHRNATLRGLRRLDVSITG
jgi:cytochrome P450